MIIAPPPDDQSIRVVERNGTAVAGAYFDSKPARNAEGEDRMRLLLAVNRTANSTTPTDVDVAPAGSWIVKVKNLSAQRLSVELTVQRDDTLSSFLPHGRQSFFDHNDNAHFRATSDLYASLGDYRDTQGKLPITGEGSLSAMVGGKEVTVIGAADSGKGEISPSPYTGAASGALPGASPDAGAVVDHMPAFPGLYATGILSGSIALLNGTSVATPLYARRLAEQLRWSDKGAAQIATQPVEDHEARLGSKVITDRVTGHPAEARRFVI